PRAIDAGRDQHGVVTRAQLIQRRVAADFEVGHELDAAVGEPARAPLDHVLFQFEAGDAVGEQAARAVVTVVDGHRIAFHAEVIRGRESRGAGADDRDRAAALVHRHNRLDPAVLERHVAQRLFHRAYGDAVPAGLFEHAGAFAEAIL